MMALAVILFRQTPDLSFRDILWPGRAPYRWAVLILFGVMPALNFVDLWDSYLSAALYSGDELHADIELGPKAHAKLPDSIQRCFVKVGNRYTMLLIDWTMPDLNVPPYPERRVYRKVAEGLRDMVGDELRGDVVLVIHERPTWQSTDRQVTGE